VYVYEIVPGTGSGASIIETVRSLFAGVAVDVPIGVDVLVGVLVGPGVLVVVAVALPVGVAVSASTCVVV
jgi:hypothetical protein